MSSNKPTHTAYMVKDAKEGSEWYEVGAVWPHKNGNGFDVVIPEGINVSGRIVCMNRKDKEVSRSSSSSDRPTATPI